MNFILWVQLLSQLQEIQQVLWWGGRGQLEESGISCALCVNPYFTHQPKQKNYKSNTTNRIQASFLGSLEVSFIANFTWFLFHTPKPGSKKGEKNRIWIEKCSGQVTHSFYTFTSCHGKRFSPDWPDSSNTCL